MAFDPLKWAEAHPYETGAIVLVGGLGLLWLFGFFGSGTAANTGQSNMAAAYYAAEAAQATAGTQLNIVTEQTAAATAQAKIGADAAVSINAANQNAATTIAANQFASADQIAAGQFASGTAIALTQANDALQSSQSSNYYANLTASQHDTAQASLDYINNILPMELARNGSAFASLPGGDFAVATGGTSINSLMASGQTRAQAERTLGVSPPSGLN